MAFLVGASAPSAVQKLAVPAVCLLIAFLGYGSQLLFAVSPDLAPGPPTRFQNWLFNILIACLWWTYYQACTVDPGRYTFPPEKSGAGKNKSGAGEGEEDEGSPQQSSAPGKARNHNGGKRWCKKCRRPKPPRAHHCKTCARCVPRMDHHCPWTSNCVGLQTFPHFLRFLTYANLSLWYLGGLLWARFRALWDNRLLPAYLGPTAAQLAWLTVFAFGCAAASFALGILLATTLRGWLFNTTMIEGWEIERHEAVLERRGRSGSGEDAFFSDARRPEDGPVDAVEFPYDIGFWANLCAGMGTRNFLLWFFPLAGHPVVAGNRDGAMRGAGWEYEENGLNDAEDMWPPADPAKARHAKVWRQRRSDMQEERRRFESEERWARPEDQREAFRQRQQRDLQRWEGRILGELEELDGGDEGYDFVEEAYAPRGGIIVDEGKQGWVNAEGEHLGDFGVDEDAEFDEPGDEDMVYEDEEEDDVPLGELIRRRKFKARDEDDDS